MRVHQVPQLFGIELFTQRSRTRQIAEHHGKLAAFATMRSRVLTNSRSSRRCDNGSDDVTASLLIQSRNGLEQKLAITKRRAELAKILVAQ
jgi:hypothetical protein